MSDLTKEYLVCKECLPFFHNILEDMTKFVSKEVGSLKQSQIRLEVLKFVHAKKIEMKDQYQILREFITKVSSDLERGDHEFIKAYMADFMITLRSNEYRSIQNQTGIFHIFQNFFKFNIETFMSLRIIEYLKNKDFIQFLYFLLINQLFSLII